MQNREAKRRELLDLVKSDPEKVVDLLLDLMDRVSVLEEKLALNSRNSSKPPSSDGYNKKPKPKSLRKKGRRKNGGQKGHSGKTLEFCKNPDSTIEHKLDYCPVTGEKFSKENFVGIIKRQVFDLPEPKLLVEEHWIYQYRNSLGQLITAEVPEGVRSRVQYGKRFRSWLVYLHNYQLLPLSRIRCMCADLYDCAVSEDTILKACQYCYEHLEGFENRVKEILIGCNVAHADETGLKINAKNHWLHAFCNKDYTYLAIHSKRGYDAIAELGILGRYRGRLVHDFWPAYFRAKYCTHAMCNPHLQRELVFAEEELNQNWARKMNRFLNDAYNYSQASNRHQTKRSKHSWHVRYGMITAEGYRENPDIPPPDDAKNIGGRKKKTKSRNLLDRMNKYRDEILAFMWDPDIPFSNNQAEQDIRMTKVKQKISGGFRTIHNARIFARIRSYISTKQKHGVKAWNAIDAVFDPEKIITI